MKLTDMSAQLLYTRLPDGARLVTDRAVTDENHPIGMALIKYDTGTYAAYNAGVTSSVDQHEAKMIDFEINGITPSIKDILTTYHMTQTELSRRFEIPLRTVHGWANGTRQPPLYVLKLLKESLSINNK